MPPSRLFRWVSNIVLKARRPQAGDVLEEGPAWSGSNIRTGRCMEHAHIHSIDLIVVFSIF